MTLPLPASLSLMFEVRAKDTLPGGVELRGIREERMVIVSGPEKAPITELLSDLGGVDDLEQFFTMTTEAGLHRQVDNDIVFQQLDYARNKPEVFPVSINVSMESAMSSEFIDRVIDYVETHKIDPGNIVLELSERFTPQDTDDYSGLAKARAKGILLALDDIDPRGEVDQSRLDKLGEICSYVKIDKKVFSDYSAGKCPDLPFYLNQIHYNYDVGMIGEGISPSYAEDHPELPLDMTQSRDYTPPLSPKPISSKSIVIATP